MTALLTFAVRGEAGEDDRGAFIGDDGMLFLTTKATQSNVGRGQQGMQRLTCGSGAITRVAQRLGSAAAW